MNLHLGIEASLRRSVQDAIKIGGLLMEQKAALSHGEFLPWVERELPFAIRTAQVYMQLFEHRSKCAGAAYLEEAKRIAQIEDQRQHPKARPQVSPEVAEEKRKKTEEFVRRMKEEDAKAREEQPGGDYQDLLKEARQVQDRARVSLQREIVGDQDPEIVLREIEAFCEAHLARTRASGQHMVINEMVKWWRQKSIELNRKAGAA